MKSSLALSAVIIISSTIYTFWGGDWNNCARHYGDNEVAIGIRCGGK